MRTNHHKKNDVHLDHVKGALSEVAPPLEPAPIARLGRRVGSAKRDRVALGNDPIDTLRILVQQHKALNKASVALGHMGNTDRRDRETGEIIPNRLPPDVCASLVQQSEALARRTASIKRNMERALRGVPIWEHFLKYAAGVGPVLGAYLVIEVNVQHREQFGLGSTKPSHVRRFCGLACDAETGRAERRKKGQKRAYNAAIQSQLYQWGTVLWKGKDRADYSEKFKSSKYIMAMRDVRHRRLTAPGVETYVKGGEEKHRRVLADGKIVSVDAQSMSAAWRHAADILVEDFYIMSRTLLGLPVWADYHAAKLGYSHGGSPTEHIEGYFKNAAPRLLTLAQAKALVGVSDSSDSPVEGKEGKEAARS